jgi:T5SS/PEP-CTERM-associated repeat protein
MVISNQAQVSNANTFYIGYDTASTSNSLIVTGTNSRLINGGALDLGDYGSANTLVISNGATASFAGTSYISYYAGSSNNSVLVTGAGSVWSNSSIDLAHSGSGSITIASGGTLISSNITIASQAGSVGTLNVGTLGGNDTNVTLNVAKITLGSSTTTINFNQSDTMTVDSVFTGTNAIDFLQTIALLGSGTTIFTGVGSTNSEHVIVDGGKLIMNGAVFENVIGGKFLVGYQDRHYSNTAPVSMTISNASKVTTYDFEVGCGSDVPVSKNTSLITGSNTTLLTSYLYVADFGNSNSMMINNGAAVTVSNTLEVGCSGDSNNLFVVGSSTLTCLGNTSVGDSGNQNSLTVSEGGRVLSSNNLYIGSNSGDSSNSVVVSDSNSFLRYSDGAYNGIIKVGNGGDNNSLTVSNQGGVEVSSLFVGNASSGSNNSVTVTGTNSVLTVTYYIDMLGSVSDRILVTNGGTLNCASASIWASLVGDGGVSNNVTISGVGSSWTNALLYLGDNGSTNNTVVLSAGGRLVNSGDIEISQYSNDLSNSILITGAGSTLSNGGTITIGDAGSGSITIASGGTLISSNITIANQSNSIGLLNVGTYGGNDTNVTLNAQTISFGTNSSCGTVNFNQADTVTLTSSIDGGWSFSNTTIAQLGSGTTILTGNSTNSAQLIVNGGKLILNGGTFNNFGSSNYGDYIGIGVQNVNYDGYEGIGYSNTTPASMVISNGGIVTTWGVDIGFGYDSSTNPTGNSNSSLLVTGSNSSLIASSYVAVGDGGNKNSGSSLFSVGG